MSAISTRLAPSVRASMAFRQPIGPQPMMSTRSPAATFSICCAFRQQASGSVSAAAAALTPSGILLTEAWATAAGGTSRYSANPPSQLEPMSRMFSQTVLYPRRQKWQMPQGTAGATVTRSLL